MTLNRSAAETHHNAGSDERVDPLSGDTVWIVPARQRRPNLPADGCPFCVGGLEAPEPYDVRWFPNRWPPFPDGRAEVVLYNSRHAASLGTLSDSEAAQVVDLWSERSAALGADPAIRYVLVFENRGAEVGATISHPHGQIYAFRSLPSAVTTELAMGDLAEALWDADQKDRGVDVRGSWRSWVPAAPKWPYELLLAPSEPVPDLPSLDDTGRVDLGALIAGSVRALDALFDAPMPYMLWVHQRPFDGGRWPNARLHVHVAALHRQAATQRFVAAGELGSGVWFNPVDPSDAAADLRRAIRP